jgi:hypothetical protein
MWRKKSIAMSDPEHRRHATQMAKSTLSITICPILPLPMTYAV